MSSSVYNSFNIDNTSKPFKNDDSMNKTQNNNFGFKSSPLNKSVNYGVTVDDIVKSNLKKQPFGIDYYNPPKMERAYLLKPLQGKMDKSKVRNFAEVEAKMKAFIPGP